MTDPSPNRTPSAKRFNGPLAALAIAGLMVVALLVGRQYFGPEGLVTQAPEAVGNAALGGPFTLIDHYGNTVTDADFRGDYMLVYFGYTYCPDICPMSLARNAEAMALLDEAAAARIRPILITVDPARDTQDLLNSYVGHFHPRLVGLTGTEDQVAAAAKAYRVYFSKVDESGNPAGADDTAYLVDHTAISYLMGPDGTFLQHFSHTASVDAVAERLREIVAAGD
jgi:cytochrome oxidase Cu insertion factor (SCO1/SenC/PrrC family)